MAENLSKLLAVVLIAAAPIAAFAQDAEQATKEALEKLDWLVAVDPWETETATFWKRPGAEPQRAGLGRRSALGG